MNSQKRTIAAFYLTGGLQALIPIYPLYAIMMGQKKIEGASRTTITSTIGLGDAIGAIIWFMVFAVMAESSNMSTAAGGFGLLTIILCCVFLVLGRFWKISHHNHTAS